MGICIVIEPEAADGPAGLAAADCGLDVEKGPRLRFTGNLAVNKGLHLLELVGESELEGRVHVLEDDVVMDGYVSGGLIGDMDVMTLGGEPDEGAAH